MKTWVPPSARHATEMPVSMSELEGQRFLAFVAKAMHIETGTGGRFLCYTSKSVPGQPYNEGVFMGAVMSVLTGNNRDFQTVDGEVKSIKVLLEKGHEAALIRKGIKLAEQKAL